MKIRFGVIGLGNRGSGFALTAIKNHPDIELVAVCDPLTKRFVLFPEEEIIKYTDYHELLECENVDAVFIATPDDTHAEVISAAVKKEKHILCEKPLEISQAKIKQIEHELKDYPKVFLVGYVLRYAPLYYKAKQLLDEGAIGNVIHGSGMDHINYGGYAFFHDWHRNKENSGSLLFQKGTHSLDIINWLINSKPVQVGGFGGLEVFGTKGAIKKFGKPLTDKLNCQTCPHNWDCEESIDNIKRYKGISWLDDWPDSCVFSNDVNVDDHQALLIKYQNNAIFTYSLCQFSAFYRREFQFFGTKGELYFDDERHEIIVNDRLKSEKFSYKFDNMTGHGGGDEEMIQDFIGCVRTKKEPRSTLENSITVSELVFSAEEAITENRMIDI